MIWSQKTPARTVLERPTAFIRWQIKLLIRPALLGSFGNAAD